MEDVGRVGIENRGVDGWECVLGVGGVLELLGLGWGFCGVWRLYVLVIGGDILLWMSVLYFGLE